MDREIIAIEGNGARPSHRGGGYSNDGTMYTLNATEVHAVAYRICSYHSNAMLSSNPNSGCYVADKCPTLDSLNCGYPGCNQGGVIIVEGFDGQNTLLTGDRTCTLLGQHNDYKNVPGVVCKTD